MAISTFEGHSDLHALHSRHKSKILNKFLSFQLFSDNWPDIKPLKAFARPLVDNSSSLVTIYDGHITPDVTFLQAACPLHISIAEVNPNSLLKLKPVFISFTLYLGLILKFSSISCESTIFPGFISLCGSKLSLSCLKAEYILSPNIFLFQ